MFSGSAVVDWKNTSGFGKDGKPPLVLIYTAAGHPTVQCLAFSTDGRTFTKYAGNPGRPPDHRRQPRPEGDLARADRSWVMVLYVGTEKGHTIHFLTSPNLKEWKLAA